MRRVPVMTTASLRRMPLPRPDSQGDKETRGTVLVVGGSAKVRASRSEGSASPISERFVRRRRVGQALPFCPLHSSCTHPDR